MVTEETRPDYVVLTMPVGAPHKKTPQENSTRKTGKKNRQEKPVRKTDKKSLRREQIWEFCQEPRSASEILELLGLRNKAGMLTMTEPETPTSRNQRYKAVEHNQ